MKLLVIFCIILLIAITVTQRGSTTSKITSKDLSRYRILVAIASGTPFGLISYYISKHLTKPAVSDDEVRRKNPLMDGL